MTIQNSSSEWLFIAAYLSCLAVGMLPGLLKFHRESEMPLKANDKLFISSKDTFYHARIKPRCSLLVAVVAVFFVGLMLFQHYDSLLILLTAIVCLFSATIPLLHLKIKEVAIADDGLLVSNFSRSVTVPFSQIRAIKAGNTRATTGYVFVEFEAKGPFGKKIYFMPVNRLEIKRILAPLGIRFNDSF